MIVEIKIINGRAYARAWAWIPLRTHQRSWVWFNYYWARSSRQGMLYFTEEEFFLDWNNFG